MYVCTYLDITFSSVSVYISEWTNSATNNGPLPQEITTNSGEPLSPMNCHPFLFFRLPTSFHKPSAVCVLRLLFVCIKLKLLKSPEEKKNLILIELGKVNLILLTEWQEESCQRSRRSDTYNTASLNFFYPISFICPVVFNFKYQGIYRSRSLSRYCS